MAINEVFPNPTVKQVIFQITFPNLFYIESKIGDLQIKIMDSFPESSLLLQKQIVFAVGDDKKIENFKQEIPQEQGLKVWNFENNNLGYKLQVSFNSLSITSTFHKTYNNENSEHKFRDIIKKVLVAFSETTKLPIVNRIGLRYIDECPIKSKTTNSFRKYYNSCLNSKRFPIEETIEYQYVQVTSKGSNFIRYAEFYNANKNKDILVLDFDGFSNNVKFEKLINICDQLHEIISSEYELTIKGPVYTYMRKEKNG